MFLQLVVFKHKHTRVHLVPRRPFAPSATLGIHQQPDACRAVPLAVTALPMHSHYAGLYHDRLSPVMSTSDLGVGAKNWPTLSRVSPTYLLC